jgi:hypothetical protein
MISILPFFSLSPLIKFHNSIGQKDLEWSEIRKVIRGDEFIGRILNFDPIVMYFKKIKSNQTINIKFILTAF